MRSRGLSTGRAPSDSVPRASRLTLLIACLGLVMGLSTQVENATTTRALNLEQLSAHAGRIFSGRVVDVREERDPALGLTVSRITFQVTRASKGTSPGRLTITTLPAQGSEGAVADGSPDDDADSSPRRRGTGIRGMPSFRVGEEVVLFLYGDSSAGLTSPVGLGQGKLPIVEDKHGRRLALSAGPPGRLLEGLSPRAASRLGTDLERWRKSGAIPPDQLLDMVEALIAPAAGPGGRP